MQPPMPYEITVEGCLDERWSGWFDGLRVASDAGGRTTISGPVADQAALHGLLAKVRDLGLSLIAVDRVEPDRDMNHSIHDRHAPEPRPWPGGGPTVRPGKEYTMATGAQDARTGAAESHRGPSLALLGSVFAALFAASIVIGVITTGGAPYPTPYDPPEAARNYFGPNAESLRIGAFLQFGSAIVLGLFSATVTSRLRFLGMNVAGVTIALFGGVAASILLAVSALTTWVITQPGMADDLSVLRALQLFGFAIGGPGHVAALGLLMAGVSVPSAVARLTPRWLVWLGLILAVVAELSTLTLIFPPAAVLLPLARFPALAWAIGIGFTMPTSRTGGNGEDGR
jgi:hypothetical protein